MSPQVLTPATASTVNRPLAPIPGSTAPPISVNKTWVLPPKPKPGRKPAVDTPPSKRKAQNREAQRAFRERRAAKVGELEDEMKKMEEEDAREQEELRIRIRQLENSVREYENMLNAWHGRYKEMETACGKERHLRERAESEVALLRRGMTRDSDAVPLPPGHSTRPKYTGEQAPLEGNGEIRPEEAPLTCGKCTTDTRCACIEEAFEMGGLANDEQETSSSKRPHSPQSHMDNKRSRQTAAFDPSMEIDFTAQFSSRHPPTITTSASTSSSVAATAPLDPCGFCINGTPCICAELSHDVRKDNDVKPPPSLSPISTQQSTRAIATSDPCVNGPGTCAQCMSDPTSKTFCQSVAASRSSLTKNTKVAKMTSLRPPAAANSTLNCAAAFTMLSQHPSFDTARMDMPSWVPQLTAIPRPAGAPERTAYDIEAASVMSVLRFFDRRFGSIETPTTPVSEAESDPAQHSSDGNYGKENNIQHSLFIAYEGEQDANSVRGPDMRRLERDDGAE